MNKNTAVLVILFDLLVPHIAEAAIAAFYEWTIIVLGLDVALGNEIMHIS